MRMSNWPALYSAIPKEIYAPWVDVASFPPSLPLPTELDLNSFETTHFKLPKSYRDFAVTFGAGDLAQIRVRVPDCKDKMWDLDHFNRVSAESVEGEPLGDTDRQLSNEMFYFGDLFSDLLAWHVPEVTSAESSEYAVWKLLWSQHKLVRIDSTFIGAMEKELTRLESAITPEDDEPVIRFDSARYS